MWQARFFKSRSLATKICASGKVRVDGKIIRKPHYTVRVGNVLTFTKDRDVKVVRIELLGDRRGPVTEAETLYSDMLPPYSLKTGSSKH